MSSESKESKYHTFHEIYGLPETIERTFERFSRGDRLEPYVKAVRQAERILLTACGSSLHLSQSVTFVFQKMLRKRCVAVPASEFLLYPEVWLQADKTLMAALSRTGETPETNRALETARQYLPTLETLSVSCYPESRMGSDPAGLKVLFPEAQEQSVVMTRAFGCILFWFYLLADRTAGAASGWAQHIARDIRTAIDRNAPLLQRWGQDESVKRIFFLGSGPFLGLAYESALKVKEMCAMHAEGYQTYEFRHGPKALLNDSSLVFLYSSPEDGPYLKEIIAEFRTLGARVILVGQELKPALAAAATEAITFSSLLPTLYLPLLYLHLPQLLAFHRAIHFGLDPDKPKNLTKVTSI